MKLLLMFWAGWLAALACIGCYDQLACPPRGRHARPRASRLWVIGETLFARPAAALADFPNCAILTYGW